MTSQVGVRALQQNASETLRRAASGEVLEITDRGRPVAKLVPLRTSGLAHLIDLGLVRKPRRTLSDVPAPLPAPLAATPHPSLGSLLAEQREAER